MLAYSYHLISSVQHEDGWPEVTLLRLAELCMLAGSYPRNAVRSSAVVQLTCSNAYRQL